MVGREVTRLCWRSIFDGLFACCGNIDPEVMRACCLYDYCEELQQNEEEQDDKVTPEKVSQENGQQNEAAFLHKFLRRTPISC